jgi:hypothetical protein
MLFAYFQLQSCQPMGELSMYLSRNIHSNTNVTNKVGARGLEPPILNLPPAGTRMGLNKKWAREGSNLRTSRM